MSCLVCVVLIGLVLYSYVCMFDRLNVVKLLIVLSGSVYDIGVLKYSVMCLCLMVCRKCSGWYLCSSMMVLFVISVLLN